MATLADFHNIHVDNDQNLQFGIFLSFAQYHDLLKYNVHVSNHITFQQLVRSYPIAKDYLPVHLLQYLHIINKQFVFEKVEKTYQALDQESYQGLVYNLVLVHLNQLN